MNWQPIFIREVVIKAIRAFFDEQDFHEVMVPTFNRGLPLEPNIFAFVTQWQATQPPLPLYLSISPEQNMKKMLALGIGQCYSIGKCFRNMEGAGPRHNPEFFMLEWYRENASYTQIMADTERLIKTIKHRVDEYLERPHSDELQYQNHTLQLGNRWPVLSVEELFKQYAHLEIEAILSDDALRQVAAAKGYQVADASWSQLFDQIFLNEVESHLPVQPFFLIDFPARLSPLCQVNQTKPYLADRCEVFMGGMEIGNGNTENLDVALLQNSFDQERQSRQALDQLAPPDDPEFMKAVGQMQKSGTSFAGIGLGVDRIAMIMANVTNLNQVEPFALSNQSAD